MLAAEIEFKDGTKRRVGPDEAAITDVLVSNSFETSLPGGFGPGDLVLPRPDRFDPLELPLWASVRTYELETNRTWHGGRIVGTPVAGDGQVTAELEGHAKALEDDETARLLGIDIDKSHWESISVARSITLAAAAALGETSVVADDTTGQPSLRQALTGDWASAFGAYAEQMYDAGPGNGIGFADFAWKRGANTTAGPDNFLAELIGSSDDILTSTQTTGDLQAAGPGSGTLTMTGAKKRYVFARFAYVTAGGLAGLDYEWLWTLLAPIGDHGIPLQGSVAAPATGRGLLVSDTLAHIVSRFAPSLRFSTGAGGSIPPTAFVVPHLVFREDTKPSAMVESLMLLGGVTDQPLDWGCYGDDGREFFCKSPGTYGRTWRMRDRKSVV